MQKRTWLIAAAGAALVVVLGAGAVMAQSGGQAGNGSTFLDRVAQKLGIESPKLQQAVTDVRNEDIDAALARGDITQQQADAMKKRAAETPGFGGPGFGRGPGGMGGPKGFGGIFGFGIAGDAEQKLADFLGIPKTQLDTELKADNATLASVAAAHRKSADDLKTFITSSVKTALDKQVADQKLTQTREDAILAALATNLDNLINHPLPQWGKGMSGVPGPGGFPGRHGGKGSGPSTTPAPQSGQSSSGAFPF
jgi:hypothetical protein